LVSLLPVGVYGEAPRLDYFYPAGAQQGTNLTVAAGGRFEKWPASVWTDEPGLVFAATSTNGRFQVTITREALPGPHWVRVFNLEGASAPRLFVVGQLPERTVADPAPGAATPALVEAFPVIVNGRLKRRNHTNVLHLSLTSGEVLQATVQARPLDSPLQAALALVDSAGVKLASSEAAPRRDPALTCGITQAGTYRLELTGAADAGGLPADFADSDAAVYRLTLRTEQGVPPPTPDPPAPSPPPLVVERYRSWKVPQPVTAQGTVHGRIDPEGEADRYTIQARRQERFTVRANVTGLGSPLAPRLTVLDPDGGLLAQSTNGPEAELTWIAPVDGAYVLALTDATGRGGPDFAYQLEVGSGQPHFVATVMGHTFRLEPGGAIELAVTITRPKFYQGPLSVLTSGLPDGVTAAPMPAPTEGDEVKLTLTAAPDAPPANQPFQVLVLASDPAAAQLTQAKAPVEGRHALPGELLLNETEELWLTVVRKPAQKANP
jgi:hypothetical protein